MDLSEPYAEGTDAIPGFGDLRERSRPQRHGPLSADLRAHTINSLQFGFNRLSRELLSENSGTNVGQLWGVDWLNVPQRDYGYPVINVAGYSKVGDATTLPLIRHTNTYQVGDGLSLNRGQHLFHLGGEVRWMQLNGILDLLTRGSLSMSGIFRVRASAISCWVCRLSTFSPRRTIPSRCDRPRTTSISRTTGRYTLT